MSGEASFLQRIAAIQLAPNRATCIQKVGTELILPICAEPPSQLAACPPIGSELLIRHDAASVADNDTVSFHHVQFTRIRNAVVAAKCKHLHFHGTTLSWARQGSPEGQASKDQSPHFHPECSPYATTAFLFIISSTASASSGMSLNRSIGASRVTRMLFSNRIPSFSSRM